MWSVCLTYMLALVLDDPRQVSHGTFGRFTWVRFLYMILAIRCEKR